MASNTGTKKLISLILVIIGVAVLIWAYQLSQSISSQLTQTFTGAASDKVMYMYIGGAVSLAAGLFLSFKK